jgi:hypothetical protein
MAKTILLKSALQRVLQATVAGAPLLFPALALGQPSCIPPTPSISSPMPPIDVSSQVRAFSNGINFFDDFSWRSFAALIWPAAQGQRGVPDPAKTNFPVTGPLVFETYKADWESFPPPSAPNPPPADDLPATGAQSSAMTGPTKNGPKSASPRFPNFV